MGAACYQTDLYLLHCAFPIHMHTTLYHASFRFIPCEKRWLASIWTQVCISGCALSTHPPHASWPKFKPSAFFSFQPERKRQAPTRGDGTLTGIEYEATFDLSPEELARERTYDDSDDDFDVDKYMEQEKIPNAYTSDEYEPDPKCELALQTPGVLNFPLVHPILNKTLSYVLTGTQGLDRCTSECVFVLANFT